MELSSIGPGRLSPDGPQPPARPVAESPLIKSEIADSAAAVRLKFLTADGQTATALEQEALFGTNDMVEASFLDRCQLVSGCIGRLRFMTPRGRSYATGFLIAPGLVMTNHHVFPIETAAQGASIEFDYRYNVSGQIPPGIEFDLIANEFFVADQSLDFAVVAVSPKSTTGTTLGNRGYLRLNPASGKAEKGDFVTIIQHPDGQPLRIALRENKITRAERNEAVIWYEADTAHGSSGAPVFNDSFQIAALHANGRIRRDDQGRYALRAGGWASTLVGLTESDVLWEANVGFRVSQICVSLLELARAKSAAHCQMLEEAMKGGDVLAAAVGESKSGAVEAEVKHEGEEHMPVKKTTHTVNEFSRKWELVVPLQLRISLEMPEAASIAQAPVSGISPVTGLETEAYRMEIPVIYDGLDERDGFDRKFLELAGDADVPMPQLTEDGQDVVAPLIDGSGHELKYHKFSIWMHKDRRLALFTASNVDWRGRKRSLRGKPLTRASLAGFPPDERIAEQWVSDDRIAEEHQLPDIFYTEDRGAFDKGHLVRRDDVCWGKTFQDIQMANGDTYHVTNCSPQIKPFNQGPHGEENWGDLESYVQTVTKEEQEEVVIYAGPIFGEADRWFRGKDDAGKARVRIPSKYWKIVVSKADGGPKAYGFVLEQDVRPVTEKEFYVTEEWLGRLKRVSEIQAELRGWVSLDELAAIDAYDEVK